MENQSSRYANDVKAQFIQVLDILSPSLAPSSMQAWMVKVSRVSKKVRLSKVKHVLIYHYATISNTSHSKTA